MYFLTLHVSCLRMPCAVQVPLYRDLWICAARLCRDAIRAAQRVSSSYNIPFRCQLSVSCLVGVSVNGSNPILCFAARFACRRASPRRPVADVSSRKKVRMWSGIARCEVCWNCCRLVRRINISRRDSDDVTDPYGDWATGGGRLSEEWTLLPSLEFVLRIVCL